MNSPSTAEEDQLSLPAGFRFHPTDDELVTHYLCRKCSDQKPAAPIIAELDLYKFDPWELPGMAMYGEKEWYFFSPRDRKYPNGSRPNRAAGAGYWKATGVDKPIGKPKVMGIKKSLVFYAGKAPRGVKTNWIMHEYRLANVDRSASAGKKSGLRLDDWVLCRLYNKKGRMEKHFPATVKLQPWSPSEEEMKPNVDEMVQNLMQMEKPECSLMPPSSSGGTEKSGRRRRATQIRTEGMGSVSISIYGILRWGLLEMRPGWRVRIEFRMISCMFRGHSVKRTMWL